MYRFQLCRQVFHADTFHTPCRFCKAHSAELSRYLSPSYRFDTPLQPSCTASQLTGEEYYRFQDPLFWQKSVLMAAVATIQNGQQKAQAWMDNTAFDQSAQINFIAILPQLSKDWKLDDAELPSCTASQLTGVWRKLVLLAQ